MQGMLCMYIEGCDSVECIVCRGMQWLGAQNEFPLGESKV